MLAISDFFQDSNYIECCFWSAIGIGFAIAATTKRLRRQCLLAAVVFVLFGASDYVEAGTGAWWRPWWLLMWKGGCLLVFLVMLVDYQRRRKTIVRVSGF